MSPVKQTSQNPEMIDDLPHLTDIAMHSSRGYIAGDLYKEAAVEFCEGYEIFIGEHKSE